MEQDKHALAVASIGGGLGLALAHVALWNHPLLQGKWGRVGGYTLGTGVLLGARAYHALRTGHKQTILADCAITGVGGAVVAACWALRIRPTVWRFVWAQVRAATRTLGSDATMHALHPGPAPTLSKADGDDLARYLGITQESGWQA